jgi:hypothetical protein
LRDETIADRVARSASCGKHIHPQAAAAAAAIPAVGPGQHIHPQAAAAAIPAVGRGQQNHPQAAAAAIPAVGRGQQNHPQAAAAAIPAVGRGQHIHPQAVAAGPVRRDQHVKPHMLVLQNLFDFVTGVLRSGATIRTFQTEAGYTTTYSIQGNHFLIHFNIFTY